MRDDKGAGDNFRTKINKEDLRDRLCSMFFSECMSCRVPTGYTHADAHHQVGKGGVRVQKLISLLLMFLLLLSSLTFITCSPNGPSI